MNLSNFVQHCQYRTRQKTRKNLYESAIRLVCNDYEILYEDLITKTGKRMVYTERNINLTEFVYKVLQNMSLPMENSFLPFFLPGL